jgi:hypothetical protein
MTTKHTPGQWRHISIKQGHEITHSDIVADVPGFATTQHIASLPPWRTEANARLIAAAPDLLNMLQRMVDESSGDSKPCLLTLEHARAALSKAQSL